MFKLSYSLVRQNIKELVPPLVCDRSFYQLREREIERERAKLIKNM